LWTSFDAAKFCRLEQAKRRSGSHESKTVRNAGTALRLFQPTDCEILSFVFFAIFCFKTVD